MNVEIDGKDFDLADPGMKAEAIRKWLRSKAETKTFELPVLPEEDRQSEMSPCQPVPIVH